ncbi:MAG TPA: erythromycin esterase family protein [Bacteroidales bacterium]|nr:erythromycin esterase family protein [Bacteroidales bacterium]
MNRITLILSGLVLLITLSCEKKEETPLEKMISSLKNELVPLSENPLLWSDDDLKFLEPEANHSIIGLGEATHGTSEFFKAKHRILRYMVENHNFKIFAIEADFGESVFLNEAVQRSDSGAIENLMRAKMHFWTWKTREVRDLLVWMCKYNSGKPDDEKVQYVGIDCQYNTYNPGLIKDYLTEANAPFYSFAEAILDEAVIATRDKFTGYTAESFNNYIKRLDALRDTLISNENRLVQRSSGDRFELAKGILYIVRQVSLVTKYAQDKIYTTYRDQFMAENAVWLLDLFGGKKMVLWAHNSHVANSQGWMGKYLKMALPDNFTNIGFLFSRGTFNAVGMEGTQYTSLKEQEIVKDPVENSINYVMSQCNQAAFAVKVSTLQGNNQWMESFTGGLQYFDIGAVYNNVPKDYYRKFYPASFDYLVYIDKTSASVLLK